MPSRGRPKGVVKTKKVKDANKPKRAATAYFCYLNHCRHEAKQAGQKISKVAEFTKDASVKWHKLGEEDKKCFHSEAEKDKKRYQAEMQVYKASGGGGGGGGRKSKQKEEGKPKRGQSSYFYFLADFRKNDRSNLSHTDKVKRAGELWRGMKEDARAPYEKLARADQARYEAEITQWRKAGSTSTQKQQNSAKHDHEEEEDDDEEEDEEEGDDDEEDDESDEDDE